MSKTCSSYISVYSMVQFILDKGLEFFTHKVIRLCLFICASYFQMWYLQVLQFSSVGVIILIRTDIFFL